MYKAILFDLDGTLTDSGLGIVRCVQYALEKTGYPGADPEQLKAFIGPPLLEQFMSFTGMDADTARIAVKYYRERYAPVGILENEIYEGIPELLYELKKRKYVLAVASSKPEMFVLQVLDHFNIRNYFDVIVGSEMNGARSEKAEVIEEALRRLRLSDSRQDVLMVGDRHYDVNGAREAGLECIAVTYGYGSRAEMEACNPLYIAESPRDILFFLKQTPMRKQSPLYRLWRYIYPVGFHFLVAQAVAAIAVFLLSVLYGSDYRNVYYDRLLIITGIGDLLVIFPAVYMYRKDRFRRELGRMVPKPSGVKPDLKLILLALGIGAACSAYGNILMAVLEQFFDPNKYGGIISQAVEGKGILEMIICVGIFAPVAEEIIFRWFLYLRLRDILSIWPAVLISALCFGIYHGNLLQAVYAILVGILCAYLLEMTGCLWTSVLLHIGANSFSSILTCLSTEVSGIVYVLSLIPLLAILIYGIIYMTKCGKKRGYRAV